MYGTPSNESTRHLQQQIRTFITFQNIHTHTHTHTHTTTDTDTDTHTLTHSLYMTSLDKSQFSFTINSVQTNNVIHTP